jgi:hypothetical protein
MSRNLAVERFEEEVTNAMVKEDRDEAPSRNQAPSREHCAGSRQDPVVRSHEMERGRQRSTFDQPRDPVVGVSIANG